MRYKDGMELDSKGLGRLRRVASARDVWTSEAGDFTPWLAENLDILADELGMSLTLVATEVPVGDFRLDVQAQTPDGGVVIVENQLERTDLAEHGAVRIVGGTDLTNFPMAAPFRRAGYTESQRIRLDLV